MKRLVSDALVLASAPLLTGCGHHEPAARQHTAVSADPAPAFSGVRHPLPKGRELRNVPTMFEQVRLTRCEPTGDGVEVSGRAVNPTPATVGYRVLVFFTDAQARAVDSAVARVSVRPGRDAPWTVERTFDPPRGVRCVVRAVRRN